MTALLVFGGGVFVGVVYEKAIRKFKEKAVRAAKAASQAMQS